jgi:hypothetical protein
MRNLVKFLHLKKPHWEITERHIRRIVVSNFGKDLIVSALAEMQAALKSALFSMHQLPPPTSSPKKSSYTPSRH